METPISPAKEETTPKLSALNDIEYQDFVASCRLQGHKEPTYRNWITPTALYKLHGHHVLKVFIRSLGIEDRSKVICDTCSLSETAVNAAIFATKNGIFEMIFNGADLKKV